MRKRIILSLISIFAFVFFSCSGLLNDIDEDSSSNKAYVQIGDTSSRTVLPAALDTGNMTDIKLIGVKDGGSSKDLLSATTYEELTGKTAEIEPGTWSFELQATINGNTFTDSTSCTDKEVNAGETVSLTFEAMETSATTGDFRVTVNYVGTADDVYVALDSVELSSTDYTVENNVVTVSKSNVEAGDHPLFIQFSKNNVVLNTFDEIVSVEGGCKSEATYTINLNELYSISVNTIEGGTVTASATSAMAGTEITLNADAIAGYDFSEWNVTDANGEDVAVTDDNTFIMPASNVTVSATFTGRPLNITDALKAGVELTITFGTQENHTVKFKRQPDGSYDNTFFWKFSWVETMQAESDESGKITIIIRALADGNYDNPNFEYDLVINTDDSKYSETIYDGELVLQTIEVNGTDVLSSLTKQ